MDYLLFVSREYDLCVMTAPLEVGLAAVQVSCAVLLSWGLPMLPK
jgi:hypothetical protein